MNYIDMLSIIGSGSAHPGGFAATLRQLREHPLPPSSRILEIGCGTGRTACYLAEQGHRVSAVDLHPQMLEKARKRAAAIGAEVDFVLADACSLPFASGSFDVVLAESVTNFTDAGKSVPEYYRVLADGGVLFDRELMIHDSLPEHLAEEIRQFFGMPQLLNAAEWTELLEKTGFSSVQLADYRFFTDEVKGEQFQHPDPLESPDTNFLMNPALWETIANHDRMIYGNAGQVSFGLLHAFK